VDPGDRNGMLNENLSDWYICVLRCAVCAAVASDAGSAMVCIEFSNKNEE
jgi:hypothetical protein